MPKETKRGSKIANGSQGATLKMLVTMTEAHFVSPLRQQNVVQWAQFVGCLGKLRESFQSMGVRKDMAGLNRLLQVTSAVWTGFSLPNKKLVLIFPHNESDDGFYAYRKPVHGYAVGRSIRTQYKRSSRAHSSLAYIYPTKYNPELENCLSSGQREKAQRKRYAHSNRGSRHASYHSHAWKSCNLILVNYPNTDLRNHTSTTQAKSLLV